MTAFNIFINELKTPQKQFTQNHFDLDTQAPVLSTRFKRDPTTSAPTTKSTPTPEKL